MNDSLRFFAPIEKYDAKEHMVYGYASTEALDSQGEVVKKEALAGAIDDYMDFANIREMHQPSAVGKAKKAQLDSKGLYIAAKIVDKGAWEKIEEGVYNGFSIGGRVKLKKGNTITDLALSEISLVDRPANPECRFDVWKMDGSLEKKKVQVKNEHTVEVKSTPGTTEVTETIKEQTAETEQPKETGNKVEVVTASPVEHTDTSKTEVVTAKEKADTATSIKKCMDTVAQMALVIDQLARMKNHEQMEETMEGDVSNETVVMLKENISQLTTTLKAMVEEETAEILEDKPVTPETQPADIYMAEKPKDITKLDELISKGVMPEEKEIIEILNKMEIEPDQKAIDAFRWEFAGRAMTKIKEIQVKQTEEGDKVKTIEKKDIPKTVATEAPKETIPSTATQTAPPANTIVTDAIAQLQVAVTALASALTPPYANRPEYNNAQELTPDQKAKLTNGVAAGSERTSSGRMTENATVQTGKADTELEIAKVYETESSAQVAKLTSELSLVKAQVQKLLDAPNPIKPKAAHIYYTLEKGQETGSTGNELAVMEKRSLELQEKLKSGLYSQEEIKEASKLSIDIMKLRREANIKQT